MLGKALSGELSCPYDRSCFLNNYDICNGGGIVHCFSFLSSFLQVTFYVTVVWCLDIVTKILVIVVQRELICRE